MKINELTIPVWVFEAISPDQLYKKLELVYGFCEIPIEYKYIKYRLMFEKDKEDIWNLKEIFKRNPHGIWYNINK